MYINNSRGFSPSQASTSPGRSRTLPGLSTEKTPKKAMAADELWRGSEMVLPFMGSLMVS